VLIARPGERIGDSAVDIAEHAAFLETRRLRRFTHACTAPNDWTPARGCTLSTIAQ
jgi:phosphate uptake regulator